ncbi:MAG: class I SAM-dependent rRNA methyltransferase [Pseudomonadota bacterium]
MATVYLQPGHVQPVWAGHPWVYSRAIKRIEGFHEPGDAVDVIDPSGKFLGRGFISPNSAIAVRILTRREGETLDAEFLSRRIQSAMEMRKNVSGLPSGETTGYRLVNSEGDNLGGLVVDVYGDAHVVQFLTVGMKKRENEIFEILQTSGRSKAIYEVGRSKYQKEEGITCATRLARGQKIDNFVFQENGLEFEADISEGQKTGFYFDQRDNRRTIAGFCGGKHVLDLFCYVGPFSVYAIKQGARKCTCVDSSMKALLAAEKNMKRNGISSGIDVINKNVQTFLTDAIIKEEKYDVVIVDPPNFAHSVRDRDSAKRAYKKLNSYAMKVTKNGGILATSCCSGQIPAEEFLRILGVSSRDADVSMRVIDVKTASADHPFSPSFEQGRYLKFIIGEIQE